MFLHDYEKRKLIEENLENFHWRMVVEFLSNKWKEDIKPLDFVADYHGEKFAFYFAWLIHYTAFLLPPSIFGIIIYIAQIIIWRTKNP